MTSIGILGSGNVARVLAAGFGEAGHHVLVGSRTPGGPGQVSTAEAVRRAEVVVNATPGEHSVRLLTPFAADLAGKVLIDVANAIHTGPDGFAAALRHPEGSLAEELQRALPAARVVKTLNTVGPASLMADPRSLATPPVAFLSGDDPAAKETVTRLLGDLGWPAGWIIDLGGVATARVPEAFILLVRPLVGALGPVPFGMSVAR